MNINSDRLSHAYIVEGGLADALAMAVVCSGQGKAKPCLNCAHCDKAARRIHPDVTFVDKLADKREIVIEQIRELKKDVIVVPNEADKKAYLINDADLMNRNAQNAFLQILEEPPKHAVFILKTDNPAELLPTVRSRCVHLKARAEIEHTIADGAASTNAASDMAAKFITALQGGNARIAAFMFQLEKLDKDVLSGFIEAAREQIACELKPASSEAVPPSDRKNKASPEKLAQAERTLVKAREMLDLNVSAGHISGMICASLTEV